MMRISEVATSAKMIIISNVATVAKTVDEVRVSPGISGNIRASSIPGSGKRGYEYRYHAGARGYDER